MKVWGDVQLIMVPDIKNVSKRGNILLEGTQLSNSVTTQVLIMNKHGISMKLPFSLWLIYTLSKHVLLYYLCSLVV